MPDEPKAEPHAREPQRAGLPLPEPFAPDEVRAKLEARLRVDPLETAVRIQRLASWGAALPVAALAAAQRMLRATRASGPVQSPGDFGACFEALWSWAAPRLVPGEPHSVGSQSRPLPSGRADGAIFLGQVLELGTRGRLGYELFPELAPLAYRFVARPFSAEDRIREQLVPEPKRRTDGRGIAVQNFDALVAHCPGIFPIRNEVHGEARALENVARPVHAHFSATKHGIDALQPQHADGWLPVAVAPGVWAVLWV